MVESRAKSRTSAAPGRRHVAGVALASDGPSSTWQPTSPPPGISRGSTGRASQAETRATGGSQAPDRDSGEVRIMAVDHHGLRPPTKCTDPDRGPSTIPLLRVPDARVHLIGWHIDGAGTDYRLCVRSATSASAGSLSTAWSSPCRGSSAASPDWPSRRSSCWPAPSTSALSWPGRTCPARSCRC